MVWGFSIVGLLACLWGLYFFGGHAARIYYDRISEGKPAGKAVYLREIGSTDYLIFLSSQAWPTVDTSIGWRMTKENRDRGFDPDNPSYVSDVFVPAWMPVLVFVAHPIRMAWWFYRRRLKGHCMCGYDLRGNTSGVCPECGTQAA